MNTSVLQHYTAISNFSIRTDVGTRRNNVGKCKPKCFCFLKYLCPKLVVPDSNCKQSILFSQLRQINNATNHRNTADLCPHNLSIIHKNTIILTACLFSYNATKAACTH